MFFISCFLFIFFIASEAYTQGEGIRIGQARLRPSITAESRFFDGAYLIIFPALQLDFPFGRKDRHLAKIIYSPEIATFFEGTRKDYVNQSVSGELRLNLFKEYHLFLSNLYRDIIGCADAGRTEQKRRNENRFGALLGREMNRLSYEFGYTHFSRDYDKAPYNILNYNENIFTLIGRYQVSPKTRLLFEYNRGEIDYDLDPTRDGHYDQIWIGLKGELTGKTTGMVKVGLQDRDYDQAGQPDEEFPAAEISLLTIFTEATKLQLNYRRAAIESTLIGHQANFYKMDRISAQLTQRLGRRFTGIGSLTFERNDYVGGEKRVDDILTTELGLQYHIREGIEVRLSYRHKERM